MSKPTRTRAYAESLNLATARKITNLARTAPDTSRKEPVVDRVGRERARAKFAAKSARRYRKWLYQRRDFAALRALAAA